MADKKIVKRATAKETNPSRAWRSYITSSKPPLTITGYSRAADKTFLHIPELKLGLDAGEVYGRQPETVFLTHTHIDHSKDLAYICQRREGCTVYCPQGSQTYIDNWVRAEIDLNNCGPWDNSISTFYPYKLNPVSGGSTFTMGKSQNYKVDVIDCIHAVPCVGYLIYEKKTKLKDEFKNLSGKEIGEMKKKNVEVSDTVFVPLLAYLGDTNVAVFEKYPEILKFPTVIVECTFFHQEQGIYERAERDGHIHWDKLSKVVLANPTVTFVLIHFSCRYKEQEIYAFFDSLVNRDENPLKLDNVVIFVGDYIGGSAQ